MRNRWGLELSGYASRITYYASTLNTQHSILLLRRQPQEDILEAHPDGAHLTEAPAVLDDGGGECLADVGVHVGFDEEAGGAGAVARGVRLHGQHAGQLREAVRHLLARSTHLQPHLLGLAEPHRQVVGSVDGGDFTVVD